jgi:uncharacterized protein YbjQ (UPF0145 family)
LLNFKLIKMNRSTLTRNLGLVIILSLSYSCRTGAHILLDNSTETFAATEYQSIEVFCEETTLKTKIIIGEVVVNIDAGSNTKLAIKYLKKEAAAIGAHAITNLRLEYDYGGRTYAIKASGTAVRYKLP